jgi:hypothetical protein
VHCLLHASKKIDRQSLILSSGRVCLVLSFEIVKLNSTNSHLCYGTHLSAFVVLQQQEVTSTGVKEIEEVATRQDLSLAEQKVLFSKLLHLSSLFKSALGFDHLLVLC